MQAQEAKPPFVGLWTRVNGFRRQDLQRALGARELVRATLMRGTLHLMSARDYLAFRMVLQPVMTQAMGVLGTRASGLELEKLLPEARKLLLRKALTFNELRPLLLTAFPKVDDRALGYAVRTTLPLVMVPTEDRWAFPSAAAFTLAEAWLDAPLSEDGAAQGLALRYLAAFGPAGAADMQTWSGLQGMKGVLDGLRPRLRVFKDEHGRELFDLPKAPRPDADAPAPPRFLPEFDNLVLAHVDRSRLLADEHRGRLVTKNLRVSASFLWDGFVGGTWSVERKKNSATLTMTPFEALPKRAARELNEEGESLLRFVEEDATTFGVKMGKPAAAS
jgi:hypothetical protein